MSTSTQAMNNINKVQTQNTGNKPKQTKEPIELNFNDLFSSALGNMAPNSQLNSIESQLRESLFKQDKPKKNDSDINTEAAQAAMWAQRDWMQSSAAPQANASAPPAASNNTKAAEPANRVDEQTASKPVENSKPLADTAKPADAEPAKQAELQATAPADEPATQSANASLAAVASPGNASAATNTPAVTDTALAANGANVVDAAATATKNTSSDVPAELIKTDQATQPTGDTTRPQDKPGTGNAKLDAALNNGSVSTKAEAQAQPGAATGIGAGNSGNASNNSAVNAQLAPQIAQQTQQAQNLGGKLEADELKVGQKILANGSLQTAGTTNGIAAGANGLTGTTGTTPQALIKTPVNQPGFAKELGQTVNWAIGKNMSTVDIRVNPENFGPMNMRLVQKGQQVQLIIRTQDEASANLLTQALGGLKEVLAQNGLQLNQVQIQHGNTANAQTNGQPNNGQDAQFNQGNGQNRSGQQSANSGTPEQDAAAANTAPASPRKADGKLDLFA